MLFLCALPCCLRDHGKLACMKHFFPESKQFGCVFGFVDCFFFPLLLLIISIHLKIIAIEVHLIWSKSFCYLSLLSGNQVLELFGFLFPSLFNDSINIQPDSKYVIKADYCPDVPLCCLAWSRGKSRKQQAQCWLFQCMLASRFGRSCERSLCHRVFARIWAYSWCEW